MPHVCPWIPQSLVYKLMPIPTPGRIIDSMDLDVSGHVCGAQEIFQEQMYIGTSEVHAVKYIVHAVESEQ